MASDGSDMELSGGTWFSEEPEISMGEEEAVDQEADGLEEELDGLEEEAGDPDQDAGPNLAAYMRGAWKGSDVSQAEIDWLYRSRRIPEEDPRLPTPKPVVQCGACIVTPRQGSPYYKFTGLESCRAWQETFFYVRNSGPSDFINLPAYLPGAPARTNWRFNPKDHHDETNRIIRYMETLNDTTNISADDIVRAFISRRVLPLQRRAHKMCQMTGRFDPTRITTFPLSKFDVAAKAKQICKTKMPVEWKWGMQPHSRRRPPPSQNFARINAEVPESYTPGRTHEDDEDPDPFKVGNTHEMGSTHTKRSSKTPASRPSRARADTSGSDDDDCIMLEVFDPLPLSYALSAMSVLADQDPQVLEHATPLVAEVGDPPAPRVRKALAPEAGSSGAPASKRQKVASSGPSWKKKRNAISTSPGPALELTRSTPGMRPEASKDSGKTQDPPHKSPAHSGAGKAPSSPRGGTTSSGSAAPKKKHHRVEEDSSSPPEVEDTGVSDTGAGSEQTGRPEPFVPPVFEKTSKVATASPSKTSLAPTQPPSPAKGAAAPSPATASKPPPAPSGKKFSRKSANITAEQLSGAVEAAAAQSTGSQALTLHAGRVAIAAGEKVSAQLGWIVELNRGEANLGTLQWYVDKWNTSDMSEATLGVGKDRNVVIDTRGPRNTVQHLVRLKHAMREFDNAWHDANNNVLGVLDSRKKLFEQLLWEHRNLTEAFAALQITHSQCQAALPESSQLDELISRVAALQAEKEKLALQHQNALQAQKNEIARLKEELIQTGLQHAGALKEAIAAGEAKVEEAKKQLADAQDQLRQELEEERKLRELEQGRNNELLAVQASIGQMVQDVDDKARKLFSDSQARAEATVAKLPNAAIKAFKCLWPEEPVLDNVSSIADRLLDTGKRLSEWRHSAARAGADTALRFVCSWYESLDLSTLNTMRGNAPTDTDPAKTAARRDRAYHIACYASTSTFIPPPADLEKEFTDDEEEATDGEEEVEGDAPEEPAAGNGEQAPEEPVTTEQAPESSSPLYQ
ncbi:hypothetical protein ACQ4PT_035949 [Festuca glaucescens]